MPVVHVHQLVPVDGNHARGPTGEPGPSVLVAVRDPTMRALTCELLERACPFPVEGVSADDRLLAHAIDRYHPNLLVVDTGKFPDCCREALSRFSRKRVIVIGPEPNGAYREAALAAGAGAWVSRDRVGDDLVGEVRRVLGESTGVVWSPGPRGRTEPQTRLPEHRPEGERRRPIIDALRHIPARIKPPNIPLRLVHLEIR